MAPDCHVLFVLLQVAVVHAHFGDSPKSCSFPESWQATWWWKYNPTDNRALFKKFAPSSEQKLKQNSTSLDSMKTEKEYTCMGQHQLPQYAYYARHPGNDSRARACVRLTVDDKSPQFMISSTIQPVLQSCSFGPENHGTVCELRLGMEDDMEWVLRTSAGYNNGTYIAISDSNPNHPIASRIYTPRLSYIGPVCVRFNYLLTDSNPTPNNRLSMYTLHVYGSVVNKTTQWEMKEVNNEAWKSAAVNVMLWTLQDMVVFEAHRTNKDQSTIALDELLITEGSCIRVLQSCDFGTVDSVTMCELLQEKTNSLYYYIHTSNTPPSQLLPPAGYGGHGSQNYLAVEAKDRQAVAHARVRSLPLLYSGDICVTFAYFMYPNPSDSLSVYSLAGDGVTTAGEAKKHWQMKNEQSRMWNRAVIDMRVNKNDVVEFEAFRSAHQGEIALDDIHIRVGLCLEVLQSCCFGTEDPGKLCSLEREQLPTTDDLQWRLQKNGILSGPETGYGGTGYYIFMDASNPQHTGGTASIFTPPLRYMGLVCVEFAYHMQGRDIDKLQVLLVASMDEEGEGTVQWKKQGEQGAGWFTAAIDVTLSSPHHRIGFKAYKGQALSGGMAVDELMITSGHCKETIIPDPTKLTTVTCSSSRLAYPSPVDILVKYPFDFSSAKCPIHSGRYQAEVKGGTFTAVTCADDKSSHITVQNGTITIQSCHKENTYEKPLNNTKLSCVGELDPNLIGSPEVYGKVLILASNTSSQKPQFYTARYISQPNGTVLLSLQGSTTGELQPQAGLAYNSAGNMEEHFTYAFVLHRAKCDPGRVLCDNGGTCLPLLGGTMNFKCSCSAGYTGLFCDVNIDDCKPGLCSENRICVDLVNDHRCDCKKGFVGENCEEADKCPSDEDCSGHGECVNADDGYYCKCHQGYTGKTCLNIDDCPTEGCSGHGTCVDKHNHYWCDCETGYIGKHCEHVIYLRMWAHTESGYHLKHMNEGHVVTTQCSLSSDAFFHITFKLYNGTHLVDCPIIGLTTMCQKEIEISRHDNQRKWFCQAQWNYGIYSSNKTVLSVRFPATRVKLMKPLPRVAHVGRRVHATCQTDSSNPAAVINWRRNGRVLHEDEHVYQIKSTVKEGHYHGKYAVSTMSFVATRKQFGKVFNCILNNQKPVQVSDNTALKGTGNLTLSLEGYTEPLSLGDALNLTCYVIDQVPGPHRLEFVWVFIANGSHKPVEVGRKQVFTKSNVTEWDSGKYECQVSTQHTIEHESITVEVYGVEDSSQVKDLAATMSHQNGTSTMSAGAIGGSVIAACVLCVILVFGLAIGGRYLRTRMRRNPERIRFQILH